MKEKKEENNLLELISKLTEDINKDPVDIESDFQYPMEISSIEKYKSPKYNTSKTGALVKIRPCADEYKNKTYLGIYIGDIPIEFAVYLHKNTNMLDIMHSTNPAIFVPEIQKIIFGYESWWGEIESEEELKEITNDDIDNIWYVKLLKKMGEKKTIKEEK